MLQASEFSSLLSSENWINISKEYCLSLRALQCEVHHFLPNSPIQLNGTSTVCLGRKLSVVESGGPSTLFLNENWVTYWKTYCMALSIFMWMDFLFFRSWEMQVKGWSTVSLLREPLMLAARGSSMLFPSENWVYYKQEYCLSFRLLHCGQHYFVQNCDCQVNGRSAVSVVREPLMLRTRGPRMLFSIVSLGSCLKEYCLPLSVFMGENITFCNITPFKWKEEALYLLLENHKCSKQGYVAAC
jgi:hypothetical protein